MIQLGSVNLVVKDIAASERFYVDMLGLSVDPERSHRPSFLLLRTGNCMLILQEADGTSPVPAAGGPVELGFEVDDPSAVQSRLGDRAVIQNMGWGNAIETQDPDGTRLNIYRLS